eukprot:2204927-Amphidinium_carterae.1
MPERYFHSALTEFDVQIFSHPLGDSSGQQCWESLAVLVAVKLWSTHLLSPHCIWHEATDS